MREMPWLFASAGPAAEAGGAPGPESSESREPPAPPGAARGWPGNPHRGSTATSSSATHTPDRSYLNLHQLRPWLAVRRGGEAMILSYITIITLESLTHIKSIYKDLLAVWSISK